MATKPLRTGATYEDLCSWFVDPLRQTLEVLALDSGRLAQLDEYHGNAIIRARPFDAIELELRALWI